MIAKEFHLRRLVGPLPVTVNVQVRGDLLIDGTHVWDGLYSIRELPHLPGSVVMKQADVRSGPYAVYQLTLNLVQVMADHGWLTVCR